MTPSVMVPAPVGTSNRLRWSALALVLCVIAASLVVTAAVQFAGSPVAYGKKAPVATAAKHRVGRTVGTVWLGSWTTSGGPGFCIDFDRDHPTSFGEKKFTAKVPRLTTTQSAGVKYIANAYGYTKNTDEAMAAAIYIWKMQDGTRFKAFYAKMLKQKKISTHVLSLVATMTKQAKAYGPYRVKVTMASGYVGQQVKGTVTVTSSTKRVVPAAKLTLTAKNGAIVSKGRTTDAKGRLTFTTRVTKVGAVRVDAVLAMPSNTTILMNEPSAGHQRLVIASKQRQVARAFTQTQRSIGAPSLSSTCSADCKGVAPVTVKMTNACGAAKMRETVYSNGKAVKTFTVAACKTAKTSLNLPDGAKVTTSYCYLDTAGKCVGGQTRNAGSLVVVCPPWVEYTYSGTCPCDTGKNLTYSVRAPASSARTYTATVTRQGVSGRTSQTVTLTNGTWTALPALRFAKGDRVQLSFTVLGKTHQLDDLTQGM